MFPLLSFPFSFPPFFPSSFFPSSLWLALAGLELYIDQASLKLIETQQLLPPKFWDFCHHALLIHFLCQYHLCLLPPFHGSHTSVQRLHSQRHICENTKLSSVYGSEHALSSFSALVPTVFPLPSISSRCVIVFSFSAELYMCTTFSLTIHAGRHTYLFAVANTAGVNIDVHVSQ